MKKFFTIFVMTYAASVSANPCCVHFPGGESGTCTLKAPVKNTCPGNKFSMINIPGSWCPMENAGPKRSNCSTEESRSFGQMAIRDFDRTFYFE